MATADLPLSDPVKLVNQLDPDAICARLEQMEDERKALLTLLRAARANQRRRSKAQKGAAHA